VAKRDEGLVNPRGDPRHVTRRGCERARTEKETEEIAAPSARLVIDILVIVMEDDKRSEASPRPSQPTPFSIADILSRRTSCADKVAPAVSAPTRRSSGEYERVENDPRSDASYDRDDRMMRYPRLSGSPELSVSRELDDILRRNLAQASLSGFAPAAPHPTQGATFEHHLEPLGKPLTIYQPAREPTETAAHRQQDEALDMSKNKYLGTLRRVTLP